MRSSGAFLGFSGLGRVALGIARGFVFRLSGISSGFDTITGLAVAEARGLLALGGGASSDISSDLETITGLALAEARGRWARGRGASDISSGVDTITGLALAEACGLAFCFTGPS